MSEMHRNISSSLRHYCYNHQFFSSSFGFISKYILGTESGNEMSCGLLGIIES